MDHELEAPAATPHPDHKVSDDEDDGAPDWTSISLLGRRSIPKRGEKDFEPVGPGSALQRHILDESRIAMLDALRGVRGAVSKAISVAVWIPEIARAHVVIARGTHFSTMGTSVSRHVSVDAPVGHRRLELLPEEVLYLMERGSLFCWKQTTANRLAQDMLGAPMSVQQAFSDIMGTDGLSPARYEVYTYLKRLGYDLRRTKQTGPPRSVQPLLKRLTHLASRLACKLCHLSPWPWKPDQWTVLLRWRWRWNSFNNGAIFSRLKTVSAQSARSSEADPSESLDHEYSIHYDVYKPSRNFRKEERPPPDFQVAIIDTRADAAPGFANIIPLLVSAFAAPNELQRTNQGRSLMFQQGRSLSALLRLWPWRRGLQADAIKRPREMMAGLKAGSASVVVAVAEAGLLSFLSFHEGVFDVWPLQ